MRSCRTTAWASPRPCSARTGTIQARVEAGRGRQRRRFKGHGGLLANADKRTCVGAQQRQVRAGKVREYCQLDEAGRSLLRAAMQQLHMSARAYHRILKLARTIADLAGSEEIQTAQLAEAIQYRPRRQT